MRRFPIVLMAVLALAGCSGEPSGPMPSTDLFAITGADALLGEELTLVGDAVVVVRDGRIMDAGPAGTAAIPEGAEVVDASGTVLMPGFIDAHVHIGFAAPHDVLVRGVTTVRDLGWPPEIIHPMAERSRAPDFDGPLIVAAGPMLTVAGGYPTKAGWAPPATGLVVTDPEAAVEEAAARGATVIKVALNAEVGPTLERSTLEGIVRAAHAKGLRVTGHVTGLEELDKALDAGVDELAHMLMSSETIPQQTIERMVAAGMTIVPTLSVRYGSDRRIAIDNTARFIEAGGQVVYGTDLGNSGPGPGIDRREIDAMTAAGMDPLAIVRAATVTVASWLGLDTKGAIAAGLDADLIAVGGSPLENASDLTDIRMVWRAGRRAL